MNVIETIFRVAPDGGSGALEALLIVAPIMIASLAAMLRRGTVTRGPAHGTEH